MKKKLIEKKLVKQFNFNNSFDYMKMLEDQVKGKNNSWAIRWYASAFLKNKLTLYPKNSFVKNIGIDGSGTHGYESNERFNINKFQNKSYKKIKDLNLRIEENILMKKKIETYFHLYKSKTRIKNIIRKLNAYFNKKIKKTLNIILKRQIKLSGNYRSWKQALKFSKGYNDNIIFEKTVESLEKVLSKQAIFERELISVLQRKL